MTVKRAVRVRRWAGGALAAALAALGVVAPVGPANAEMVTRSGHLSVTPGWTSATFDRDGLVLPFSVTAPCVTTDFGSGYTSTNCDTVIVDLIHPSTPASEDSDLVFPREDGTGTGSVTFDWWTLRGFGTHTLRATDQETGETATATVTVKALTRTTATFTRTKEAPAAATMRVAARLTFFDGSGFSPASLRHPLTLQRRSGNRWSAVRTAWTVGGVSTWSLKVGAKATYRVCHPAGSTSIASCTSARTI